MAATDLGATLRGVLELLAVVLIIMCLVAISVETYRKLVARTQISEAFFVTSGLRVNMALEHALTGRWSVEAVDGNGILSGSSGRYTGGASLQPGGGLDVRLLESGVDRAIAGRVVSIRPFFFGSSGATLVLWNCGSHTPPPGYVSQARDGTTVPVDYLPNNCRDR